VDLYLSAVVLGIVEGLTEFLPVSSTGHLVLVSNWLGLSEGGDHSFDICIQAGAILAVVVLYYQRFLNLVSIERGSGLRGLSGNITIIVACIPALIIGAIFGSKIKSLLFNPTSISIALIIGGIIMILVERSSLTKRTAKSVNLDQISLPQSLIVGLFQCLALCPGASRSASTIIGGMIGGLDRKVAAEFSFIIAVPMLLAATAYELLKSHSLFATPEAIYALLIGLIVSFFSALVAIKFFISLLSKLNLIPFAVYRIILGIVVLVLSMAN